VCTRPYRVQKAARDPDFCTQVGVLHEVPAVSHDLVIRGGTVVDGTGAPARTADARSTAA
jgi:hypothetical protein